MTQPLALWTAPTPNGWKVSIMIEELRELGIAPGTEKSLLDGVPREVVRSKDAQGSGMKGLHVGSHGRLESAPARAVAPFVDSLHDRARERPGATAKWRR